MLHASFLAVVGYADAEAIRECPLERRFAHARRASHIADAGRWIELRAEQAPREVQAAQRRVAARGSSGAAAAAPTPSRSPASLSSARRSSHRSSSAFASACSSRVT